VRIETPFMMGLCLARECKIQVLCHCMGDGISRIWTEMIMFRISIEGLCSGADGCKARCVGMHPLLEPLA